MAEKIQAVQPAIEKFVDTDDQQLKVLQHGEAEEVTANAKANGDASEGPQVQLQVVNNAEESVVAKATSAPESPETPAAALITDDPIRSRTIHVPESVLNAFDDYADAQRRKKREKRLAVGEPANVGECAAHLLTIALQHVG